MIASAERAGRIILCDEAEPESIASCFVLRRVVLEVVPKVIRQGIFGIRLRF